MIRSFRVLSLAALCMSPLVAADGGRVDLSISMSPSHIHLEVSGPSQPVVGAIVLSFSPDLVHYLVGLPPLLADFSVLSVGVGEEAYKASIEQSVVPPGLMIYAQGVVFDGSAVLASDVGHFVLDAGSPELR